MEMFRKRNLENIKTIFEEKTGVELETVQPRRSTAKVVLLAAVLTCLFVLTGYATATSLGIDDALKDFFRERQKAPLSDSQENYVGDHAAAIGESVTCNGVTVTVGGAISDGTTMYILLNIRAEEGLRIEELPLGFDMEMKKLRAEGEENDLVGSVSTSCIPIADDDGQENTASMLMEYRVYPPLGSTFSFADGRSRTLQLRDLHYYAKEYPYDRKTVAEGLWEYEIVLTAPEGQETELLAAPVAGSYTQISGNSVDATIHSIRAKGLSVTVYYTLAADAVQEAGDFGVLRFTMQDGTVVPAYPEKAGQTVRIENGDLMMGTECHYCTYAFAAPVNSEQITTLYLAGEAIEVNVPS